MEIFTNPNQLQQVMNICGIPPMRDPNMQQQMTTNQLHYLNISEQQHNSVIVAPRPLQMHHDVNIKIIEQPQDDHDYKFRYENEKQHAPPILGQRKEYNNNVENDSKLLSNDRRNPAIQITNAPPCHAQVWIQCVESDYDPDGNENPRPSPNCLFIKKGKVQQPLDGIAIVDNGEKTGVVKLHINNLSSNNGIITFEGATQLALFRTTNDNIWEYLRTRNFVNGNTHATTNNEANFNTQIESIDIPDDITSPEAKKRLRTQINTKRVRLCFQVFLYPFPDVQQDLNVALRPVCSAIIVDKRSNPPLHIDELSQNTSPEAGLRKVILLCNKIEEQRDNKNKVEIRFTFKDEKGNESHSNGTFVANDVHHQYAITFIPPACPEHLKSKGSLSHVHAKVQLYKDSGYKNEFSNAVDFIYFSSNNFEKSGKCIGAWNDKQQCKYIRVIQPCKSFSENSKQPGYRFGSIIPPGQHLASVKQSGQLLVPHKTKPDSKRQRQPGDTDPSMCPITYLEPKQVKNTKLTPGTNEILNEALDLEDERVVKINTQR
jgi:hypothetical protein